MLNQETKTKVNIFIYAAVSLVLFISSLIFSLRAKAAENLYQAEIVEQSNYVVNLLPGKAYTFAVKLKNTGSESWTGDFLYIKSTSNPSPLKHSFWINGNTPVNTKSSVAPGESLTIQFALQAPVATGLYVERFALTLGSNNLINGSLFELPVNVTQYPNAQVGRPAAVQSVLVDKIEKPDTLTNSTDSYQETTSSSATTNQTYQTTATQTTATKSSTNTNSTSTSNPAQVLSVQILPLLSQEPLIKVGLYYEPTKKIRVTAEGEYYVYVDGVKQATFGAGAIASVVYLNGVYNLILPSGTASFSSFPTFRPNDQNTILELPDYNQTSNWNTNISDNRFAGDILIKYNPLTDRLWAVNELPLETYVAGIAETSNINVPEFQKSMAVAARTYALYHLLDNTRYNGFFHVHDYNDQIYRGINSSRRLTYFVDAVKETAGQVVTLNNEVAVTPYFTQSNGRTRSYNEVWGSSGIEASHLVSVPVLQDQGRPLLGHGVGMSAQGAQRMAYLESMDYQAILKHFYTGTLISQAY